ncbi:unnamed protein product [Chondrus crispus]|uniref:2-amino-4-hydroxy-6-hydroxymethyldihydropteridine diphosphokinase n=1 Tax=Chondrus crispus TaxID=2769 RepID=R7QQ11_CHOCR|nr:unnamed protein product [Chondrus crispus]CDF40204.1 unnamed protein product [Chondrus crispus]|eukprot:XP_005710498.1 unnamed protein product [Chondrus crispus]
MTRHAFRRGAHSTASSEKVSISLGSNVGNRVSAICKALDEVRQFANVCRTSFLYESPPMYVEEQPALLNAACEIETTLELLDVLQAVKRVEKKFGRDQKSVGYGPRSIDLDIIAYGERLVQTSDDKLVIPHPRRAERDFVLRPLSDNSEDCQIPRTDGTKRSAVDLLSYLLGGETDCNLVKVTPTNTGKLLKWGSHTLLMGIINATPDSFSDGGENNRVSSALRRAEEFAKFDFDVLDIGGQSTRPGAETVGANEELKRVLAITDAIRREFPSLIISTDTFDASVASEMVAHGAEINNDVAATQSTQSGGRRHGRAITCSKDAEDEVVTNLKRVGVQKPLGRRHKGKVDGVGNGPELCGCKRKCVRSCCTSSGRLPPICHFTAIWQTCLP